MGRTAALRGMKNCMMALLVLSPPARASDTIDVYVERMPDGYHISAVARTRAPVERAWAVLTDFNHLADFVPDMRSSRIVSAEGEPTRVEQHGVAQALLFKRDVSVTLAVTLLPMKRIEFRSVGGSLRTLDGEWRLLPQADGCRLEYSAVSDPGFWTPPLIGPALVRGQVLEQIEGVLHEIESDGRSP